MNQSTHNLSLRDIIRKCCSSSLSFCIFVLVFVMALKVNATPVAFENTLAAQLEQSLTTKNKVNLTVSPEQCVAMQQGQNCYVEVDLTWQADKVGNYCLYNSIQPQPLQCWHKRNDGIFKKEYTTKANLLFFIKVQSDSNDNTKSETEILAKTSVKMAWVHKKKGKPRKSWRLF